MLPARLPVAAGAGGLGGSLRYLASLPYSEPLASSQPLLCEVPPRCPTLLALLEDYVSSHQLGVFVLFLAFGAGAGFALGCIVGFSWGVGRCFTTGSYQLLPPGVPRAPQHPRLAGYSPQ